MTTGTVKFFNYNRGYGFISDDAGGTERRFRIRSVVGDRVHVEMTPTIDRRAGSSSASARPARVPAPVAACDVSACSIPICDTVPPRYS